MKRDWNLIRTLLLKLENGDTFPGFDDYSDEEVGYHFKLLVPDYVSTEDGIALTERGNELLNALRDERKYKLAMKEIESRGLGPFSELLVDLIKRIP